MGLRDGVGVKGLFDWDIYVCFKKNKNGVIWVMDIKI